MFLFVYYVSIFNTLALKLSSCCSLFLFLFLSSKLRCSKWRWNCFRTINRNNKIHQQKKKINKCAKSFMVKNNLKLNAIAIGMCSQLEKSHFNHIQIKLKSVTVNHIYKIRFFFTVLSLSFLFATQFSLWQLKPNKQTKNIFVWNVLK